MEPKTFPQTEAEYMHKRMVIITEKVGALYAETGRGELLEAFTEAMRVLATVEKMMEAA